MIIRALEELTEPDERALRFTPWGLSTGSKLTPRDAARFQQEVIRRTELAEDIPDSTRQGFERLCSLHTYGLFCYDLYTAAEDLSLLVLEQALRERFVAYYGGVIPVIDKHGNEDSLTVSSFDDVYDALNKGGSHAKGGWRVRLANSPKPMPFNGGFTQLLRWARKERLLRGQRNRRLDGTLVSIRNHAAHPSGYGLTSPVESGRSIQDLAEIINQLWGAPTRGGRLYPAPVHRDIFAVGWDRSGATRVQLRAELLEAPAGERDWTYLLVRAVEADEAVLQFDSRYEVTTFPAHLLWGPGPWRHAVAWLKEHQPTSDEVDYLDRLFVIRRHEQGIDLPQRPEVAASLAEHARTGTWHLIRADYPNDAFLHVRGPGGIPNPDCSPDGFCYICAVEIISIGSWDEVLGRFKTLSAPL